MSSVLSDYVNNASKSRVLCFDCLCDNKNTYLLCYYHSFANQLFASLTKKQQRALSPHLLKWNHSCWLVKSCLNNNGTFGRKIDNSATSSLELGFNVKLGLLLHSLKQLCQYFTSTKTSALTQNGYSVTFYFFR